MLYIKRLKIILPYKRQLICLLLITTLFVVFTKNINEPNSKYNIDERRVEGKILSYSFLDQELQMVIQGKEKLQVWYHVKDNEINDLKLKIKSYNKVYLEGKLSTANTNTIPNVFSYQKYLQAKQIYYVFNANKIEVEETNNVIYKLKQEVEKRASIFSSGYIKAFILGQKDELNMENYRKNGINHLFAVSGMHLLLIISFLNYIVKGKHKEKIILIILAFYTYLLNFQVSILRAFAFYIMNIFNNKLNKPFTKLELFIILFCIFLIINPFVIWDITFQYSFLITFFLLLIPKEKNKIKSIIKINVVAFLASLPITAMHFYEVNFLSLFINFFLSPFLSFIVYPFSFITFIFSFCYPLFHFLTNILEWINEILTSFSLKIIFPKCFIGFWLIYYILLFFIIKGKYRKRKVILLVIYLFLISIYPKFKTNAFISFLDVGQGDCALFVSPYQKEVIMIDTGGKVNDDNTSKNIATYLKSLGINLIDTLILTHGDYDHAGNALKLKDEIKIKEVLLNKNKLNSLELEITKNYKITNKINSQFLKMDILASEDVLEENNASLVILVHFWNYKILMMGDAEKEIENKIMNKVSKVDILKVGHHGSKTSSSYEFLNHVLPKYAIISVGKNNSYHLPNNETINNLNKLKIKSLLTSEKKTIEFYFEKTNYQVKTFFDTINMQKR